MNKQKRFAILINPPIYDTQYWARWSMPHGLLKIGTWLRNEGYDLHLFDCLNPYGKDSGVPGRDGVMDFESYDAVRKEKRSVALLASNKERILGEDPDLVPSYRLSSSEKWKYTFGMPLGLLEDKLHNLKRKVYTEGYETVEIWITSIMTYWWESTRDVIKLALEQFPDAKVRIGGIYPTLASDHARQKLFDKGIEPKVLDGRQLDLNNTELMEQHLIVTGEIRKASDLELATDLYEDDERPPYTILTTSRGCPHICSYCASNILNDGTKVRNRQFDWVMNEIKDKFRKGTKVFCFYEDNLLMNMQQFKDILKAVMADRSLHGIRIYAPEGIEIGVAMSDRKRFLLKLREDKRILATLSVDKNNAGELQITLEEDLTDGSVQIIDSHLFEVGTMRLLVGDQDTVLLRIEVKDNGRHEVQFVNEQESELGLYLVGVPEIVYLMKLAGFEKIYLPLETIKKETNARWNRSWNSNLTRFESLLNALEEVGFDTRKQHINAFVMFGLPGEDIEEIYDTALYASERVGSVIPMLFTPVPSTQVFDMYKDYIEEHGYDLQHLNGKLFPFFHMLREQARLRYPERELEFSDYLRVETFMQRINTKVQGESVNIFADSSVANVFRQAFSEYKPILG
ncbi:radical SAM protein [Tumebacillus permanentifrigoris]|uniref:Radical SAM family protein n=1 Tax=Tumebacillus permanentifrigoris TaxID=378543 RepID=A0A316D907_9BACL|nr:radical SAM protein [Tumebacillus permanentifrigoris]PWK13472.1 radical SAM family protein [Tumebacillus permanentifrigoris]